MTNWTSSSTCDLVSTWCNWKDQPLFFFYTNLSNLSGIATLTSIIFYHTKDACIWSNMLDDYYLIKLSRRVPWELFVLLEHMSSNTVLSGVRVTLSLVLCVCFVDRCLFFCTLAIVSVFLRFTDSDYPLSIFKLILLLEMSHCMFFNWFTDLNCHFCIFKPFLSILHRTWLSLRLWTDSLI
jgi:hypothetical protein